MKKIQIGLILSLLSATIQAQVFNFEWARSSGGFGFDEGRSITTDTSGNVYIAGYFEGTADFDPSPAIFNLTAVGETDIFIQKLDASGNLVWAKSVGGVFFDFGYSITIDIYGDVYTAGWYYDTVDFDPGPAIFNLTSIGSWDVFIQKLNANGNFIWAKSMGGKSTDIAWDITTDALGNIYTTGYYADTADFDPGIATINLTSAGAGDVFIQKLDSNGIFIWAKSVGGVSSEVGYSIATDALNNVYLTGYFQDTLDFDPGPSTFNLIADSLNDIFIQKLDANGNFVWAKSIGGTSDDFGRSISVDAFGNVFVTGRFQDTVDFDPSTAIFNLASHGESDIFILKLDSSGNFIWAKSVGGSSWDEGNSIAIDAAGNVYVIGYYNGLVDFDPSAATFNQTSNGFQDIFIQKLDGSGNFMWAGSIGGMSGDNGTCLSVDASGNLYLTGLYEGTVDFNPNSGLFNLTSSGSVDFFIQKLSQSTVGIIENKLRNSISVFPNPTHGYVVIALGDLKEVSVKVFTATGQLIYQEENIIVSVHQFQLNEASGIYIIEVSSQDEKQYCRLVKM